MWATVAQEKALGFLSPSAHEEMMTNALGWGGNGQKTDNLTF